MNILIFFFGSLFLGVLISMPAIVVGKRLAAKGIVKDHSVFLLSVTIPLMFMLHLRTFPFPWYAYIIASVFPFTMYRSDFWSYQKHGPYWWREVPTREITLTELIILVILILASIIVLTWWVFLK